MGKRKQEQPDVRELANSIGSEWRTLLDHVNNLGLLLLSKKKVRVGIRVGIAVLCFAVLLLMRQVYDQQPIVGDQRIY